MSVERAIDKLRISTLKAQVEASRLTCEDLERQFRAATTEAAKTELALRYRDEAHHNKTLRQLLDLLERASPEKPSTHC